MGGEIPKFSLQNLCIPTKNPPESKNEHLTVTATALELSYLTLSGIIEFNPIFWGVIWVPQGGGAGSAEGAGAEWILAAPAHVAGEDSWGQTPWQSEFPSLTFPWLKAPSEVKLCGK